MRGLVFFLATAMAARAAVPAAQPADSLLVLPPVATTKLARSLEAARAHRRHVWRDTPPFNQDGTVNGYIEIAKGDRRKWELDMRRNARAVDRMMPVALGGYPINYGFVPQTISYDGDPFDVLVLGPPIPGGTMTRGAIVGLMLMEDETGHDAKVVISPVGPDGRALLSLTAADRRAVGDFFNRYKEHEPGKFSKVPGWASAAIGRDYVVQTHAFFQRCTGQAGTACLVSPAR
jgi:inorganic pyrophosphatase